MKTRATSLMLAALAVVSFVLPALAASSADELPEETPVASAELEEVHSAVRLDGEPVDTVEYEIRDGECKVRLGANVEEENGAVCVNASTVTQVIPLYPEEQVPTDLPETQLPAADPVDGSPEAGEDPMASEAVDAVQEGEGQPAPVDSDGMQGGEPAWEPESAAVQSMDVVPADVVPADVVTADLDLQAAVGDAYLVANGRYLYVRGGLIDPNGAVAAPVRQLAQVFNLTVDYDGENDLVLLGRQEGAEPYLASGDETYDGDTMYWLSRIINAESGNQSMEGKIAVGNVVMNRVHNPRFPENKFTRPSAAPSTASPTGSRWWRPSLSWTAPR